MFNDSFIKKEKIIILSRIFLISNKEQHKRTVWQYLKETKLQKQHYDKNKKIKMRASQQIQTLVFIIQKPQVF